MVEAGAVQECFFRVFPSGRYDNKDNQVDTFDGRGFLFLFGREGSRVAAGDSKYSSEELCAMRRLKRTKRLLCSQEAGRSSSK